MRVAFILNEFPVLSETFVLDQITGLLDRDCQVDIAAHVLKHTTAHADVARYDLLAHAQQLLPPSADGHKLRAGIRRLAEAARLGVSQPRLVAKTLNPLQFGLQALTLKPFYRVAPFLRRPPADVLHAHFGPNGRYALELRQLGVSRAPIVTHFYGYDASSYLKAEGNDVYRELFAEGEVFLCVSELLRRRLIALGCDSAKVRVHRLGIKLSAFPFRLHVPEAGGPLRLLSIGRLVEKKGLEFGLRAVALIKRELPNVRYTIVGGGPLAESLSRLTRELGVDDVVELAGQKTRAEITELIDRADIFLAPSVVASDGDEEGIPVVISEAMARGLPVISTQHAGIPELVQSGVTGLLAPERDPEALAAHVLRLNGDHALCRQLSAAGRKAVEAGHDIDVLNDQLLALYRELIARPNHYL